MTCCEPVLLCKACCSTSYRTLLVQRARTLQVFQTPAPAALGLPASSAPAASCGLHQPDASPSAPAEAVDSAAAFDRSTPLAAGASGRAWPSDSQQQHQEQQRQLPWDAQLQQHQPASANGSHEASVTSPSRRNASSPSPCYGPDTIAPAGTAATVAAAASTRAASGAGRCEALPLRPRRFGAVTRGGSTAAIAGGASRLGGAACGLPVLRASHQPQAVEPRGTQHGRAPVRPAAVAAR